MKGWNEGFGNHWVSTFPSMKYKNRKKSSRTEGKL